MVSRTAFHPAGRDGDGAALVAAFLDAGDGAPVALLDAPEGVALAAAAVQLAEAVGVPVWVALDVEAPARGGFAVAVGRLAVLGVADLVDAVEVADGAQAPADVLAGEAAVGGEDAEPEFAGVREDVGDEVLQRGDAGVALLEVDAAVVVGPRQGVDSGERDDAEAHALLLGRGVLADVAAFRAGHARRVDDDAAAVAVKLEAGQRGELRGAVDAEDAQTLGQQRSLAFLTRRRWK
jgi:hypothetical protein